MAYLLAEEGLQHLAEEEQQRVPGVQQVGAVHGHVLGAGSRVYINLWLHEAVFMHQNGEIYLSCSLPG